MRSGRGTRPSRLRRLNDACVQEDPHSSLTRGACWTRRARATPPGVAGPGDLADRPWGPSWRCASAPSRTPRPPAQSLEVILVNAKTDNSPAKPEAHAQANAEGGGDAEKDMAQSPRRNPATRPARWSWKPCASGRRRWRKSQQSACCRNCRPIPRVSPPHQSGESLPDANTPGREDQDQDSVLQNAQVARWPRACRPRGEGEANTNAPGAPSSRPRRKPRATRQYLDAWRARYEAVGTRHYPDEARDKLYGTLRITVNVRADGSVADVGDRPAVDAPVLNQAARRIVQLAAPFAPLPARYRPRYRRYWSSRAPGTSSTTRWKPGAATATSSSNATPGTGAPAPGRYAVIGNPVAHSRSPRIHALFSQQTGIALQYGRLPAPVDGFADAVRGFFAGPGARPERDRALQTGSLVAGRAEGSAIRAPGRRGQHIVGARRRPGTAAIPTAWAWWPTCGALGVELAGARALMAGAGDAARGVLQPLAAGRLRPHPYRQPHGRTRRRAGGRLAARHRRGAARRQRGRAGRRAQGRPLDVVINATASSLGDAAPDLPAGLYAEGALAYDMMYSAQPTPFLRAGPGRRRAPPPPTAWACWWARRPKASSSGTACGPTPSPCWPRCGGAGNGRATVSARHGDAPRVDRQDFLVPGHLGRDDGCCCAWCMLYQLWLFCMVVWYAHRNPAAAPSCARKRRACTKPTPPARLRFEWVPYDRISNSVASAR